MPTVAAAAGVTVTPGTGELTLAGLAPTILTPVTVTPGVGVLTLTGFAPTVQIGVTVSPGLGQLTLAGLAPTIQTPRLVTAGLGALTLTGFAPVVTGGAGLTRTPGTGELVLTGFEPTVIGTVISPPVVGGRVRRRTVRITQPPTRRRPLFPADPKYGQLVEDVVVTSATGRMALRGYAPRVVVSNDAEDDRIVFQLAGVDEDLALALTLADTWMT